MLIKVNCETQQSIKLNDLAPFQGDLKKRSDNQLKELETSLLNEGLMMPFAVWRSGEMNYLLDGHARLSAMLNMIAAGHPELLEQDFPYIEIHAETEEEARKALLQITSSYGNITASGYKQFTASIPNYTAPSIKKFVPKISKAKPVLEHKKIEAEIKPSIIEDKKEPLEIGQDNNFTIIKIRIPKDKLDAVKAALSQVSYIEVL